MVSALRVLIVEDLAIDAELMAYELRQGNLPFTYRRVDNDVDFLREMEEFRPHLILSDFNLPVFNGMAALALAQQRFPEVPFIFVSGAIGEEVAIESLKRGATDYILKDRMSRLAPAVKRALREAAERRERRMTEEALRESEQQYRLLVGTIPAVVYKGYLDWSVDFVDNKIQELTGYSKVEFDNRRLKWDSLIIPNDLPGVKKAFQQGRDNSGSYVREYRIRAKDGRVIWVEDRGQIVIDDKGQAEYVSGVFFDATERQRAKTALQESEQRLRFLTSQLLSAQEQERKRISMELHDELGQSLTVLKLQIRAIEKGLRTDDQPELKQECLDLLSYLDGVIDNVRRLSRDLSPAILEDLGLMSALKYLLDGISKHFAIKRSFAVDDLDSLFPLESQIVIYRIFQECLNNITKHAEASEVSVTIRRDDESVCFILQDDGVGFDPSEMMRRDATGRGLGLAALDERARMLGGNLNIWSQPGNGTKITCFIPVEAKKNRSTY